MATAAYYPSALGGLGNATIIASAPTIASGALTAASAAGISWATAAIPFVGPALAGVALWLGAMYRRGAQKEAATRIVNELEPKIQENLQAYLDSPRTPQAQAQALANFDAMWNAVLQACGDNSLGAAGTRCISERQAGGVAPWCNTPDKRGCDWFTLYRDPIANDTVREAGSITETLGSQFGLEGRSAAAWLTIAAAVGVAAAL